MVRYDTETEHTLDHVLSIVIHKFGNSLNSHNMALEVLLRNFETFEDPKKIHFLERALQQTKRQQLLLSALKHYSGLSVGDVSEVPFHIFWRQFHQTLAFRFKNTPIRFESRQNLGDTPVVMETQALSQALHLLIDNAVDAVIDQEAPEISLTASALPNSRNRIALHVSDNGPGIPDQSCDNIFTPLFSTRQDRFGLGLPLARKITNALYGGVRIIRNGKAGTTAEIWLRTGLDSNASPLQRTEENDS